MCSCGIFPGLGLFPLQWDWLIPELAFWDGQEEGEWGLAEQWTSGQWTEQVWEAARCDSASLVSKAAVSAAPPPLLPPEDWRKEEAQKLFSD